MYNGSTDHLDNLNAARALGKVKVLCSFCERSVAVCARHQHERYCKENPVNCGKWQRCPVCDERFYPKSTDKVRVTCGRSCANKMYPRRKKTAYRTICFDNHAKECVVCGERRIVEVHHLDEDNTNNSPGNLVPLCPTHHKYWHSRHRSVIEQQVTEWLVNRVKLV